jgi:hypothetical protein
LTNNKLCDIKIFFVKDNPMTNLAVFERPGPSAPPQTPTDPPPPDWGAGGEMLPRGEAARDHPEIVAALKRDPAAVLHDGSLDRCLLSKRAGILDLALETAYAARARSATDQSLAHQLASVHVLAMRATARAQAAFDAADQGKASDTAALCAARLTGQLARIYRESVGMLERVQDMRRRRLGGPSSTWPEHP